ncbi:hypothetical protein HYV49_03935 [Candidatus Pacearchaeota archaeon]|nr:hypothetical protein [Candidatus Pacearchaeota archaeon]
MEKDMEENISNNGDFAEIILSLARLDTTKLYVDKDHETPECFVEDMDQLNGFVHFYLPRNEMQRHYEHIFECRNCRHIVADFARSWYGDKNGKQR